MVLLLQVRVAEGGDFLVVGVTTVLLMGGDAVVVQAEGVAGGWPHPGALVAPPPGHEAPSPRPPIVRKAPSRIWVDNSLTVLEGDGDGVLDLATTGPSEEGEGEPDSLGASAHGGLNADARDAAQAAAYDAEAQALSGGALGR